MYGSWCDAEDTLVLLVPGMLGDHKAGQTIRGLKLRSGPTPKYLIHSYEACACGIRPTPPADPPSTATSCILQHDLLHVVPRSNLIAIFAVARGNLINAEVRKLRRCVSPSPTQQTESLATAHRP